MGDTFMATCNPILVENTLNAPTIICVQRNAEKIVPCEDDIIKSNKLAFNDDIGVVTNHVTSMFDVQAGFAPGSAEYKTLNYRIMCGQLYQQNCIDRAKGIIAKPMPSYWYSIRENIIKDGDDAETREKKAFNQKIVAARKPYFMSYVYPSLRKQNNTHNENCDHGAMMRFLKYGIRNMDDLLVYEPKTKEMTDCLRLYDNVVGNHPCVVNRICWRMEDALGRFSLKRNSHTSFDYDILKSHAEYSRKSYDEVLSLYKEYQRRLQEMTKNNRTEKTDAVDNAEKRKIFVDWFRRECEIVCSNEKELCDIVLDICYRTEKSKQFAWDVCGNVILDNLLERNHGVIHYPQLVDGDGDFEYGGENFVMREKVIGGVSDDSVK